MDAVADVPFAEAVVSGCAGLLATDGTGAARIYPGRLARTGLSCRTSNAVGQAEVLRAIALVKVGRVAEAAPILEQQAMAMLVAGCCRVVMVCTKVPLALAGVTGELRPLLVDATKAWPPPSSSPAAGMEKRPSRHPSLMRRGARKRLRRRSR